MFLTAQSHNKIKGVLFWKKKCFRLDLKESRKGFVWLKLFGASSSLTHAEVVDHASAWVGARALRGGCDIASHGAERTRVARPVAQLGFVEVLPAG